MGVRILARRRGAPVIVIPAQAGIQLFGPEEKLDSGLRRNDDGFERAVGPQNGDRNARGQARVKTRMR